MKNLEILILTVIVIICFVSFFISTFREFEVLSTKNEFLPKKRGIISRFLAYLESLVSE